MTPRDLFSLLSLAALWGASYLFMRLGASDFGAVVFAGLRAALAAAVLLPLLLARAQVAVLVRHWRKLLVLGLTQSALPFVLFSFAAPRISTGLAAILGATTPLFTAAIARAWSGERLTGRRTAGLLIGFGGVVVLVAQRSGLALGAGGAALAAMAACVGAAIGYGFSANYAQRRTAGLPVLAVATGSQVAAAVLLAPAVVMAWPAAAPSTTAWGALLVLAFAGTAGAYLLFYRLISRVGPARTVTVTFLVPVFGAFWGWLCLDELLGVGLLAGGAIILSGTALTITPARKRAPLAPVGSPVLSSCPSRHG